MTISFATNMLEMYLCDLSAKQQTNNKTTSTQEHFKIHNTDSVTGLVCSSVPL